MQFFKYSGSGNTFLIAEYTMHQHLDVVLLCATHQVDGLILIQPSKEADFKMRILNSDGSEAEMCGNGMRCAIKCLIEKKRIEQKNIYHVETACGIRKAFNEEGRIGVCFPYPQIQHFHLLDLEGYFLNTGVPHAVFFVEDLEDSKWMALAPKIRSHPYFSKTGTNVNFVQFNPLRIRTYERGVEGETLSCGTGAVAAAFASYTRYGLKSPLSILPRSGESLLVDFKEDCLILSGPAALLMIIGE